MRISHAHVPTVNLFVKGPVFSVYLMATYFLQLFGLNLETGRIVRQIVEREALEIEIERAS